MISRGKSKKFGEYYVPVPLCPEGGGGKVVQSIETLRYKSKVRGLNSR
jgi:hypothetical protein